MKQINIRVITKYKDFFNGVKGPQLTLGDIKTWVYDKSQSLNPDPEAELGHFHSRVISANNRSYTTTWTFTLHFMDK